MKDEYIHISPFYRMLNSNDLMVYIDDYYTYIPGEYNTITRFAIQFKPDCSRAYKIQLIQDTIETLISQRK